MAKRRMGRVLYSMLGKGSKQKLVMDIRLLLKYGKMAGKAIGDLLTSQDAGHRYYSALLCRPMDPNMAFYSPGDVEFSCSNSPTSSSFRATRRRHRHRHHHQLRRGHRKYDAATVAKVIEIFNSDDNDSVIASPSPPPKSSYARSPVVVVDGVVDWAAEEFIQGFYEQLRREPRGATPEPWYSGQEEALLGRD